MALVILGGLLVAFGHAAGRLSLTPAGLEQGFGQAVEGLWRFTHGG